MNIKDKLQQHLVMSMFATQEDLYEEMNNQREEALIKIIELEARLKVFEDLRAIDNARRDKVVEAVKEIAKDQSSFEWWHLNIYKMQDSCGEAPKLDVLVNKWQMWKSMERSKQFLTT